VSDKLLDLRKCNYSGKNLSGKTLAGALLSETDMSNTNLTEAVLTKVRGQQRSSCMLLQRMQCLLQKLQAMAWGCQLLCAHVKRLGSRHDLYTFSEGQAVQGLQ
jgi:hypothetical protein